MKFALVVLALALGSQAIASVLEINLGNFSAYTEDPTISALLKSDPCARETVKSVKANVFDELAMNDGVDLPESIDVSFLQVIGTDAKTGQETYSITASAGSGVKDYLVQTTRSPKGRTCKAGEPYTAGI